MCFWGVACPKHYFLSSVCNAAATDFLPASHTVHELAPLAEKRPAVQSSQADALSFDHVPLSHFEHALEPAAA